MNTSFFVFFFATQPGRSKVTTFHAYLKRFFLQNRAFWKKKVGQRSTQVGQRAPNRCFLAKIIWHYKCQEKQVGRSKVTTHPTTSTTTIPTTATTITTTTRPYKSTSTLEYNSITPSSPPSPWLLGAKRHPKPLRRRLAARLRQRHGVIVLRVLRITLLRIDGAISPPKYGALNLLETGTLPPVAPIPYCQTSPCPRQLPYHSGEEVLHIKHQPLAV